jgi:predicted Zn-dependent peptidase
MPARVLVLFLLLALLAHPAPAAPQTRPITQETFGNGLTVIVAENHATDVVTLTADVQRVARLYLAAPTVAIVLPPGP